MELYLKHDTIRPLHVETNQPAWTEAAWEQRALQQFREGFEKEYLDPPTLLVDALIYTTIINSTSEETVKQIAFLDWIANVLDIEEPKK